MQRLNYLVISALVIAGCASSQVSREATTPAPAATSGTQMKGMRGDMEGMCPMMSMQDETAEPPPASSEDHESHHPEGKN